MTAFFEATACLFSLKPNHAITSTASACNFIRKLSHVHIFDASVSITQSSFGMNMFRGCDCLTSVEFIDCSLSNLEHHCLRLPVISQAWECWNPLRSFVTTPKSPLILCSIVGNHYRSFCGNFRIFHDPLLLNVSFLSLLSYIRPTTFQISQF